MNTRPRWRCATITVGADCLEWAGLTGRHEEAFGTVHRAVDGMDGANWIDVMVTAIPIPRRYGMSVVYPRGCGLTPDTAERRELQHRVEETVRTALLAAGVPF